MNERPSISVVIPTFNRAHTLERSILSVISQDFSHPIDLWVVDDASTDGTHLLVENIMENNILNRNSSHDRFPIHYLRLTENKGVSAARNEGIKRSRGNFLAFLDSDDEWLPVKLKRQWELLGQNPELKIIYGEEIWIRNGVRVNQKKKHEKKGGEIFLDCLPLCFIGPSTSLIDRAIFEEVGLFDESFPVCEDYELWLRITARHQVGFVSDPLIKKYGGHGDQLSRKYVAMDLWRVRGLAKVLGSGALSNDHEKKRRVLQEIVSKCNILLKGHLKHQQLSCIGEVLEILDRATKQLESNQAS